MNTFSNLAISLDGRIADADVPDKALGTPLDRRTMQVIRRKADVILFGAGTLRAHPQCARVKGVGKSYKQPVNAVVTASGKLDPAWPFWKDDSVIRIVFTTEKGLSSALKSCRDRALVVECGKTEVDVNIIFKKLDEMNFKNVLVEGGGVLMASVLEAKLLQSMYVTLTPWILGGAENPSLVAGDKALWSKLELIKQKRVKNEVYLQYRVKGARRV